MRLTLRLRRSKCERRYDFGANAATTSNFEVRKRMRAMTDATTSRTLRQERMRTLSNANATTSNGFGGANTNDSRSDIDCSIILNCFSQSHRLLGSSRLCTSFCFSSSEKLVSEKQTKTTKRKEEIHKYWQANMSSLRQASLRIPGQACDCETYCEYFSILSNTFQYFIYLTIPG